LNVDVAQEARSVWRRRLAALALRRLQSPLNFPSFHDTAEGHPDPEALLDDAERYFSLLDTPEADRMSTGLRDQVRELQSGRYAESSLREDLGGCGRPTKNAWWPWARP
jgi:hypothetical protein